MLSEKLGFLFKGLGRAVLVIFCFPPHFAVSEDHLIGFGQFDRVVRQMVDVYQLFEKKAEFLKWTGRIHLLS